MIKQLRPALVSVLVFTLLTGLVFPAVITAIAQTAFHSAANGSLIERNGKAVGSALIGQNFALPRYFHPRPSAAGSGYDASASSGTNLGPTSKKLIEGDAASKFDGIKQLAPAYRRENNLPDNAQLPADAVTRSASGLDPDISPANAELQAGRVARARNLTVEQVKQIIAQNTSNRQFGVLGEPRVNVLQLNLALDGGK